MRFPSGKSAGFAALVWGVPAVLAVSAVIVPAGMRLIVIAGAAAVTTMLLWIWFGTYYEFQEECLMIRFGPFFERIPYERIFEAKRLEGMASSMALSGRMIELRHGENYLSGTTCISPKDREGFLAELGLRCPNLGSARP